MASFLFHSSSLFLNQTNLPGSQKSAASHFLSIIFPVVRHDPWVLMNEALWGITPAVQKKIWDQNVWKPVNVINNDDYVHVCKKTFLGGRKGNSNAIIISN